MIVGIGIDVFTIKRIHKLCGKPKMVRDFFHPFEIVYSALLQDEISYLASCFAAKEAFVKALGIGLVYFNLPDICLLHRKYIGDTLVFSESIKQFLANKFGKYIIHVSTSIGQTYAIAMVIVETL